MDKQGNTVDFMLSSTRDKTAAANFLCRAIGNNGVPEKINIDQSGANASGIELYNEVSNTEIEVRQCKYLNNIVEVDHIGLKKKLTSPSGFKRFASARRTIYGAEVVRMIRKGQCDSSGLVRPSQFEIFKELVA